MEENKSISEKIKSMTAKEIIMSMVNGLRNPVTKINMDTFGDVVEGVCFGCAATNAVCYIGNYSTDDLLKVGGEAYKLTVNMNVMYFEWAIDELRKGNIYGYNSEAARAECAQILLPDGVSVDAYILPYLDDDYTEEELACYVRLAEMQL